MSAQAADQAAPPSTAQWSVKPDAERYRALLRWLFQGDSGKDADDPAS